MADINAAVATVTYKSAAGFGGTDTLTFATNDNGNTGIGGPITTTQTLAINVWAPPVAANDTFGIAYSYCGTGNTYRMNGDHSTALQYFKKAEKIYATIGDKVSYAYTVWSMGVSLKMLGGLKQELGMLDGDRTYVIEEGRGIVADIPHQKAS